MYSLQNMMDDMLSEGKSYFSQEEALQRLEISPGALASSISRLRRKQRLATPVRGFHLILRPQDRIAGAPDPVNWIDPMMQYLAIDYRISLLESALHHGASHQAVMVFQVIVPKQMRDVRIGRHKIQFIYQAESRFSEANQAKWLFELKNLSGYAKAAGIELTLLDCTRYYRKAAGMNYVAQIVQDIGANAKPSILKVVATTYENSTVRRLGYLLEMMGQTRQAAALKIFVKKAKSFKPLNPSIKPIPYLPLRLNEKNLDWMLMVNQKIEVDF